MQEIINEIFGVYTPLVDPVTGSVVIGVAGVDWTWIAGVFLFGILLYGFLRLVAVLLKG